MKRGFSKFRSINTFIREHLFEFGIIISALIALGATAYCFSIGMFILVPHLFYIPIILVAYRYPRRAVASVSVLAIGYFAEVVFFSSGGGAEAANALSRIAIFFIVAVVISNLSSRLQARENRYRGIFETSGPGIFLFSSKDKQIAEMNPGCFAMLGYSKGEALPQEVSAIWPEYPRFARALEEGRIEGLSCNLATRSGTPCPVLLSADLLPDREMVCVVVTGTTKLKQAKDQLRRSEETLRVILNTTDVGILLIDSDKAIVEANEAAVRLFGTIGREYLVGLNSYGLVAEESQKAIMDYRERVLNGETPAPIECMLRRFDGTVWPAEIAVALLTKGENVLEQAVISFRDITERRRAEEAMREENRRLAVINEVMAVAAASRQLDVLLRASLEKTLALLDFELGAAHLMHPGNDRAYLRASVGEWAVPPVVHRDEPPYSHILADGEARFVDRIHEIYPEYDALGIRSFASVPIPGDGGPTGCITAASRIRETIPESERLILVAIGEGLGNAVVEGMLQEDLEAALASANRYLEEAEAATVEVNLYVDILTHDINNANTAAMGYLQMYLELAEPDRVLVEKSLSAVYQSSEIIRNVLTLRQLKDGPIELRPVRLKPVLRRIRSYYADASIICEGVDVVVHADGLIDEIFANLIGNSIKFGGSDVEVTVSVREDEGGMVSVKIADTGPGIPDDLKPRLFERNQRGATNKSGKGLGLYIVRMLAERYGGSVQAGDRIPGRPEEGAAITVTLPRYSPWRK